MKTTPTDRALGFLAGLAGGVAGALAMNAYWRAVPSLRGRDPRERPRPGREGESASPLGQHRRPGEASMAAAGRLAYEAATGAEPGPGTESALSHAVHLAYGAIQGGLYGALRAGAPQPDLPGGLAFGAALWLLGDELALPALGLAEPPGAYPARQHAHRLVAHLAYGAVLAAASQALYRLASRAGS